MTGKIATGTASWELRAVRGAARVGVPLLRVSVGVVFLWFGAVKFVPGLSPADELAVRTISALTLHTLNDGVARVLLALLETGIGLGLLTGRLLRPTLIALFFQMSGTFTPLVLFADEMWKAPLVATLEGQYIIKNFVLVSAGIAIAATLHGGGLVADPPPRRR